ncbi:MAG: heavy metal translocating P-type ATPase [Muribaculaceae bacterium]|nr:heavy metal translocating P-type ATPase [Muribaculaceae bacterium]
MATVVEHHHNGHHHSCCADHCNHHEGGWFRPYLGASISLALLIAGLILDHYHDFMTDTTWAKPLWYFVAFIPVGFPVVKEAFEGIAQKDYFNELTLMAIACIGAFCIGEYSEAVGVMLFYCIGENLQDRAVDKATRDISKLLEIKAEITRVVKDGEVIEMKPDQVQVGNIIEVHPGERVPLDGVMLTEEGGMFDTAALTGESVPREIDKGGEVLAGMISSGSTVRINVIRPASDSALSRILDLVKNAQAKKAKSEVFIRKFARIYTPVVTLLAFLVVVFPYFISLIHPSFVYHFNEWLYRALVFLVISCPCALVISVPLSYFAGIGAASRQGILFKGGNYLETIKNVNVVAFDKTGTLTTGQFSVEESHPVLGIDKNQMLAIMAAAESESSHPLAKAIVNYVKGIGLKIPTVESMHEVAGKGTKAVIEGKIVLAGNLKLLKDENISYPGELNFNSSTIVALAINGEFAGYVILQDTPKLDSARTVTDLHNLGVDQVVMLSGDRKEIVDKYAGMLGIKHSFGELLPQDKAEYVEKISKTPGKNIAFVGDGMNDAPVLAISNVGVAMGGLGSDAAIESADIVIQTDNPSKVATAIKIGRYTHKIVMQNIIGALVIKVTILTLGIIGFASLWAAVFADVGVTMLAVLNSMRVLWHKY